MAAYTRNHPFDLQRQLQDAAQVEFARRAREESPNVQYAVFSTYYKRGDISLSIYDGTQIRAACLEELAEYAEENEEDFDEDYYDGMSISELVAATVVAGDEIVANQRGYGWRYVVSGTNLQDIS